MKRKYVSILTILFALITSLAIFSACKGKEAPRESGDEVGTYYCDVNSEEWTIELSEECKFTLELGSTELTGSYYLEETSLRFVSSKKGDPELSATLQDDVITLSYNDSVYRFLKKITYTVTFNSNGGSQIADVPVINGKTVAAPATDPVKEGYVFIGWYTDNGTFRNEYIFSQPVRGDLTLNARFVEPLDPEFTVTLDLNYEGAPEAKTVTTIGGKVFNLEAPTRSGYEFAGWWVSHFESADKLTYEYDEQQLFSHTTFFAVWKEAGMPVVSVSATGVSWKADGLNNSYTVKITPPTGEPVEATVSGTSYTYNFAAQQEGTYEVEVTLNGKTATAYYINKGLARVSVFGFEGTNLLWNPVPNATGYEISYVCGTEEHDHEGTPVYVTEPKYNFKECDMVPGGFVFVVRAVAEGYVPSLPASSEPFERTLDAVSGIAVDAATQVLTWDAVANATSYDVRVTLGGAEVYSGNVVSDLRVDLKALGTGDVVITIMPKAHGWNSPAATEHKFNKTALAAPAGFALVGHTLQWEDVDGAVKYEVTVGDNTVVVNTNEYELDESLAGSTITVLVRAIAANTANNSPLSNAYTVQSGTMSELTYANGHVSWDAVFGATVYFVSVNGGEPMLTTGTSQAITFAHDGINVISVYAMTSNGATAAVTIEVEAFAVEFNVGTGHNTTTVDTIYLATGDPIPVLAEPTRLGYDFVTWCVDEECADVFTDATFLGNSTLTLYASWTPTAFTITLIGDPRYSDDADKTFTAYYEQPYMLPVPDVKGNEMTFLGWYDQRNAGGNKYTDYTGEASNVYNSLRDITLYAAFGEIFTFTEVTGENAGYRVSKNLPNITYVKEVKIPAMHLGAPVTEVIDFSGLTNLEVIRIPSSIKYVNLAANSAAFMNCISLREVEIYDATEEVGKHEPVYFSHQGVLYMTTGAENLQLAFVPAAIQGVIEVMAGTQLIPQNAFASTKGITEIILPASVTHVEEKAFISCTALTRIEFLATEEGEIENPLMLSNDIITSCAALVELVLPSRLYDFSSASLASAASLNNIFVVGEAEIGGYASTQNGLLCKKIETGLELVYIPRACTTVVIPTEVVQIGEGVLGVTTNADGEASKTTANTTIESITIPATVSLIKRSAFRGGSHLQEIIFDSTRSDTPLTIEDYAFYGVGNTISYQLKTLTLPGNLVKLGQYAFGYTSYLTHVNVESAHATRTEADGAVVLDFAEAAFGYINSQNKSVVYYVTDVYLGKDVPDLKITEVFGNKVERVTTHEENDSFETNGDGVLYNKGITSIRFYPAAREKDYVTPATLTDIPSNVLFGNLSIVNLTIGTSVTRIGDNAFQACENLETVTFLAGGTAPLSIGAYAFGGTAQTARNTLIKEIVLPARTTELAAYAFGYMSSNLESISIPDTLEKVGEGERGGAFAFAGRNTSTGIGDVVPNNELTTIKVTEGLAGKPKTFTVVDNILYKLDEAGKPYEFVFSPRSSYVSDVTVPGSVQVIGESALAWNTGIVNIAFAKRDMVKGEDGVERPVPLTILANAFYYNTGLETIALPEGLESVGENTFAWCSKLRSIRFSTGLKEIGENAFYYCQALEYVFIPNTVELLRSGAFRTCTSLKTVEFEEGNLETELVLEDGTLHTDSSMGTGMEHKPGIGVFSGCTALSSIRLPERTTQIGISAFAASGIAEIYIPSTVTRIGDEAFYIAYWADGQYSTPKKATNISKVEFAENSQLESIGKYAFYYSKNLATIELPDSVKSIGIYAFSEGALTSIKLPEELTEISNYAFYQNPLTTLELNEKISSIGNYAFSGAAIKSLTIPASLSSIGTYAFASNKALESLTFEDGSALVQLSNNAFNGSTSLVTITFGKNMSLETIGTSVFGNAVALKKLELPEGLKTLGASAFSGATSLTSVTFPSTLEEIDSMAFSGCTSLTTLVWNTDEEGMSNIKQIGATGAAATNVFQKTALTTFDVPASHNNIMLGRSLFNGVKTLTQINLSAQVTSLDGAFTGCSSISFIKVDPANQNYSSKEGQQMLFDAAGASIYLVYGELTNDFKFDPTATTIGSGAFKGQTALTKIVIPASVKTIGAEAFRDCINLEEVQFELGSTLETIGINAFAYCTNLEKINFEDTRYITNFGADGAGSGKSIFYGCEKLKKIDLSKNSKLTTIPQYAFQHSTLEEVVLPNGLTTINSYAFYQAPGLKRITLPASFTTSPGTSTSAPFYGSGLEEVTICGTAVPQYLFYGATNLTTVKFEGALTTLNNYAFQGCTALTSIELPSTLRTWGTYVFQASGLTSIEIPFGVTSIGNYAFNNCASLETVTLPASITSFGTYTFQNCKSLQSITIPAGVTTLSSYMFNGCSALTEVNLPDTLTKIDTYAFQNCESLASISLPNGITTIGNSAFIGCAALEEITLPTGLTSLGTYAFQKCTSLTSIAIPAGIATIGNYTFDGATKLAEIDFGSVSTIGQYAFRNTGLVEVVLPATISTISGTYAFTQNANLKKVSFAEGCKLTSLPNYTFYECRALEEIDFTNATGLTHLGTYTFRYTALVDLDLSPLKNLKLIGSAANSAPAVSTSSYTFADITTLETITMPASLTHIAAYTFLNANALTAIYTKIGDGEDAQLIEGLPNVVLIGNYAFQNAGKNAEKGSYKLALNALATLGTYAFQNNNSIAAVDMTGSAIAALPNYSFNNAINIAEVKLSEKTTSIGNNVFSNASKLTQDGIDLSNITSIGGEAFFGTGFTKITIPAGLTSIGNSAFVNCPIEDIDPGASNFTIQNGLLIDGSNNVIMVLDSAAVEDEDGYTTITVPGNVNLRGYIFNGVGANKLVIENGITEIPSYTFFYGYFDEVVLPDSLTTLATYAFQQARVAHVTIPASVTKVNSYAFQNFAGRNVWDDEAEEWIFRSEIIFECNGSALEGSSASTITYLFQNAALTKLVLPETGLTILGNYWFDGVKNIEEIVLPDSITTFGSYLFRNSSITRMTLPRDLTTSSGTSTSAPFYGTSLEEVTIRGNIVPNYMFYQIASLTTVNFDGEIESIGNYAFHTTSALTALEIPETVKTLGTYVFYNSAIESITLHEGIQSIGMYAFYGTASLQSIEIPASVESIGTYAFQNSGIQNITLHEGLTSIGNYAFKGVTALESIEIPASVTTLGTYLFQDAVALTSVKLPDGLAEIPNYMFSGAEALTEFELPAAVTKIGSGAFQKTGIKSITIHDGVTFVGTTLTASAFNGSALEEATFEGTALPNAAFAGAANLKKITFTGELESIGNYAFAGTGIEEFVMPETVTTLGNYAFQNCANLKILKLSDAIERINDYIFQGCTSLEYLALPKSLTYIGMQVFRNLTSMKGIWISGTLEECYTGTNAFCGWTAEQTIYFEASAYEVLSSVAGVETFFYQSTGTFESCNATLRFNTSYDQFMAIVNANANANENENA